MLKSTGSNGTFETPGFQLFHILDLQLEWNYRANSQKANFDIFNFEPQNNWKVSERQFEENLFSFLEKGKIRKLYADSKKWQRSSKKLHQKS